MNTVTISSKYQVVIPKKIRAHLDLKPGQKVQVISYKGRVELIPQQPLEQMQGFLKGIETTVDRDKDRL